MINIEHVTKRYDRKLAVDDLTVKIDSGSIFAFLGPNGAGKTTTSKMIVGLLKPTSGTITVRGMDVEQDYERVKSIASYVPDQPYAYDKLSGREFLYFVGRMYGMSETCIKKGIGHYAELLGAADYVDNLIESCSHGMKQRIVIMAALLHEPEIIVVDEPLVGLDPRTCRIVKDTLREKAEAGATVFMSTHMISVAEETADKIGIIDRGRLLAVGSPEELKNKMNTGLEDVFLTMTGEEE